MIAMKYGVLWVLFVSSILSSMGATLHVSPGGSHTPSFADWASAATNIQSAVNIAINGDTVWVKNGTNLHEWGCFQTGLQDRQDLKNGETDEKSDMDVSGVFGSGGRAGG